MSDMVEIVARAIAKRRMRDGIPADLLIGNRFDQAFDSRWNGTHPIDIKQVAAYRADARAAIEAMQEPTKEMKLSIAAADWKGGKDLNWSDGWSIMIDAALK